MRNTRIVVVLVLIATVARVVLATVIPLFPDETYYWEWSRRLAAGYFDHPPAIALLIRSGTTIFGATSFAVRIGAILAGAVASLAVAVTSWRLADSNGSDRVTGSGLLHDAGARAAFLMLVIPGALVGFVLATPDAPLLAAIALTLASLERAIASPPHSRSSLGWWCAAGLTMGVAFCSKYTSVLVPAGVFVALVSRRDLRTRLAEPGPYVATFIAAVVLLPTLLWNARHGWISFAFQLQHGLGQTHGSVISRELALIGGQLGIVSPIIAVMAAVAVAHCYKHTADGRRFVFAVVATFIVAFFLVSAFRRPVEANWPVPALVAAIPLLATMRLGRRGRTWLVAGSAVGLACSILVAAQAVTRVIQIPPRRDAIARAFGWTDLANAVRSAEAATTGCATVWLAADRYQDASELAFNLAGRPQVFALNLGGRANQYDLWPSIYSVARRSDCALIVVDDGPPGQEVVRRIGADAESLVSRAVMMWHGIAVGQRAIWLVRGIPSAPPVQLQLSATARAALSATSSAFQSRSVLLDSIVAIYRHGPIPDIVTTVAAAPVTSTDRKVAITARVASLHALLQRAGVTAVYRDARYTECTFVRSSVLDSTDIGYVYAPQGCRLAAGRGDALLLVEPAQNGWYSYASPRHNDTRASTPP